MRYVVIDTNVIVSAFLAFNRQTSAPYFVVSAAFAGIITPVLTTSIMKEYREVLTRKKFGFDPKMIETFLLELKTQSVFINPSTTRKKLPDPKDKCFYDAAVVYEAIGGLLVTGNVKHFPDCPFVVTPAQLKERLSVNL